ncbi:MAG TPA: hypothetical protein VFM60_07360 [Salinimicrobium sp.]|nr:hypothetical protein [Salinimicrobium sp.]
MKQLLTILICFFLVTACGNDAGEEALEVRQPLVEKDSIPTLSGEFIFLNDAAVLKGRDFIYGVQMDSTAMKLARKLEPLKKDNFDMVPVVLKAKIIPNPRRDGWDEIIEIRKIIQIPQMVSDSAVSAEE